MLNPFATFQFWSSYRVAVAAAFHPNAMTKIRQHHNDTDLIYSSMSHWDQQLLYIGAFFSLVAGKGKTTSAQWRNKSVIRDAM